MLKRLRIAFALATWCGVAAHGAAAPPVPEKLPAVDIEWAVRIPLRDGVQLSATIYKPQALKGRVPALFVKSPYLPRARDIYHDWALFFADHGYAVALVDCRGRGDSEGSFRALDGDGRDGYDVVEWLARQPWSSAQVGMFGGSYDGYGQWATLKELPPHLKTIVPTAAVGPGLDFPKYNNVFGPYAIQWLTYVSGRTLRSAAFNDFPMWQAWFLKLRQDGLPLVKLPELVDAPTQMLGEWLAHPAQDSYWQAKMPEPAQYRRVAIPILTITGDWDGDQRGALNYYSEHMAHGTASARARHFLVLGPWDHGGTRRPSKRSNQLDYGDNSLIQMRQLHLEWYDWTLKGKQRPDLLKDRFVYYVIGPEEWRHASTLEAATRERRKLYLDGGGGPAHELYDAGRLLEAQPSSSEPDRISYDPLVRPVAPAAEAIKPAQPESTLVYYSEPLEHAIELTGQPRLTLSLALDVPDTDIAMTLTAVRPNGSSLYLGSTTARARYRESLVREQLVQPGAIARYTIESHLISIELPAGSRLRLAVGAETSAGREHNYNGGGVVAREDAKAARTVHIQLYHDAAHPSFLELPLGHASKPFSLASRSLIPPSTLPPPLFPSPAPSPAPSGSAPSAAAPPAPVAITWNQSIALRDGVHLNATIYRAKSGAPMPAIVALTARVADDYHGLAMALARAGYAFVSAEARGRGNSEGSFKPFTSDGKDGFDVVEWAAAQPWSSGSVGMCGSAYDGYVAWATLKARPPHLRTLVAMAPFAPGVSFPLVKGVFLIEGAQWLMTVAGRYGHSWTLTDPKWWVAKVLELRAAGRPLSELASLVGPQTPILNEWMEHASDDGFWQEHRPSAEDFSAAQIPILTITGQYDPEQAGALDYHREHLAHGGAGTQQHFVVIGPWSPAVARQPPAGEWQSADELAGLKFGSTARIDFKKLHQQWFDWILRKKERPELLKDRVAYYALGADAWRHAPSVDKIPGGKQSFYLTSRAGSAGDVVQSGSLVERPPPASAPDSYVDDPLDRRVVAMQQLEVKDWIIDARGELPPRGHGVIYHSAPLERAIEIAGLPKLVAWLVVEPPGGILHATLYQVKSDGTSIRLGDDYLRARMHRATAPGEGGEPQPERYEFSLSFTARRLDRGSRLRLVVAPPMSAFVEQRSLSEPTRARAAKVSLYHDQSHASVLELPLAR